MSKILGYHATNDPEWLTEFIARAEQAYQELEDTLAPIDVKIKEVDGDWDTRWGTYWKPVLKTSLPAMKRCTHTCLALFDKENTMPIGMIASSLGYRCALYTVERQINESGIILTAYMSNTNMGNTEKNIREHQRLVRQLKELSKHTHEAIKEARSGLSKAPTEQVKLLRGER